MVFEVTRRTTMSASEVWALLTDWERHSGHIPWTTIRLDPGAERGSGVGFVARTALGPLRFDDPMEVTFSRAPTETAAGICRIVKRGRAVTGWAVLTVTPDDSGAVVHWYEEARFAFTGPFLNWPTAVVGRKVFSRLLDGLFDEEPRSASPS